MTTGAWVLIVAVVVAAGFGLWRRATDGRFRDPALRDGRRTTSSGTEAPAETTTAGVLEDTPFAGELGERATLLQFSSAFCAPCRATRQVLGQVAEATPGVVHVEVDAEQHLDLVRRLGVLRTPTTLVLDASGAEVTRAGGAPTRQQVLSALESVA